MTEQPQPASSYRPNPKLKRVEHGFESLIFNSRWLMAPFYLGLVVSLAVLLFKFLLLLWEFILHAPIAKESDIILGVLGLIDISLTGNLILIVVFYGYENFVSKIDPGGHPDWPDWMTKINFGEGIRMNYIQYYNDCTRTVKHEHHDWRVAQAAKDRLKKDLKEIIRAVGSEGKASAIR